MAIELYDTSSSRSQIFYTQSPAGLSECTIIIGPAGSFEKMLNNVRAVVEYNWNDEEHSFFKEEDDLGKQMHVFNHLRDLNFFLARFGKALD